MTISKERLDELEQAWSSSKPISLAGYDPRRLSDNEIESLIAAARHCAELEAEKLELAEHLDKTVKVAADAVAERDALLKQCEPANAVLTAEEYLKQKADTVESMSVKILKLRNRCAELEARVNELRDKELNDISEINQLKTERDALRADNENLREALYAACNAHDPNWEGIEQLLETTPADSLREYRNGVLEEVISQCGKWVGERQLLISAKEIRAMKEADNDTN